MNARPSSRRDSDLTVVSLLALGVLVLFGGLYLVGHHLTDGRIPEGTTVARVNVGGLLPAAARQRLEERLRPRATAPILVTAGARSARLHPARAGLRVDTAASVAQIGAGRSWRPSQMWAYFTGGDDYDAVVRLDAVRLERAVDRLAAGFDRPARDGAVTLAHGRAFPQDPRPGRVVDREEAAARVRETFLQSSGPVRLPVRRVAPTVTGRDVDRAMARFATPAVSAPVEYVLAGRRVLLRPRDYTAALSMAPRHGRLAPVLDERRLLEALRPRMRAVTKAPVDAGVELVRGRPRVVPGRRGVTFDPEEVTDRFLSVVRARGADRTQHLTRQVRRPRFTTKDAAALGIDERVSSFTTYFPHAEYRNTNLGRAADLVDGTVLRPGEVFSLNATVGERTADNGFTKGFIIDDGVYREDYGGGVSQVATTLFNAAFFAGLKDIEHQPHSFYIDRYPVGREATVVWPSVDLRFQDDTPYGVLVHAWVVPSTPARQGEMHVELWSTKYWDIETSTSGRYHRTRPDVRRLHGPGCVPHDGYAGFQIDVYRYFHRHGSDALDHSETMHTTYTPSDTVVCS